MTLSHLRAGAQHVPRVPPGAACGRGAAAAAARGHERAPGRRRNRADCARHLPAHGRRACRPHCAPLVSAEVLCGDFYMLNIRCSDAWSCGFDPCSVEVLWWGSSMFGHQVLRCLVMRFGRGRHAAKHAGLVLRPGCFVGALSSSCASAKATAHVCAHVQCNHIFGAFLAAWLKLTGLHYASTAGSGLSEIFWAVDDWGFGTSCHNGVTGPV